MPPGSCQNEIAGNENKTTAAGDARVMSVLLALQSTVGQAVVQTYRLVPGPMAIGAVTGGISPYSYTMPRSLHYLK